MAVVKKNTYQTGQNSLIQPLFERGILLGRDQTWITFSSPNYVIAVGSEIECNGSLYVVETTDITLAASAGVLVFDDVALAFSISALTPAWDPVKGGEYVSATKRVCRWDTDAVGGYKRRTAFLGAQNLSTRTNFWYGESTALGTWITYPVTPVVPPGTYQASGQISWWTRRESDIKQDLMVAYCAVPDPFVINQVVFYGHTRTFVPGIGYSYGSGSMSVNPAALMPDGIIGLGYLKLNLSILDRSKP
jgi:hypothetical protein